MKNVSSTYGIMKRLNNISSTSVALLQNAKARAIRTVQQDGEHIALI